MPRGVLSISFDFEMAWGTRRSADPDHAPGIERVRDAVHGLLDIFQRHDISATWATVGQLMRRREDFRSGPFPSQMPVPQPDWFDGNWRDGIPDFNDPRGQRFFAPDLVEAIANCSVYQELASHTFSHVVIGESACTEVIATAELKAVQELGRRWGRDVRSVVFPRNQIGHLDVLQRSGHTNYRGVNNEWYYFGPLHPTRATSGIVRQCIRILRLADELLAITPKVLRARRIAGLWELPHSMFFPGRSGLSRFVSPSRIVRKAIKGLHRAAETGGIFSLYTHEHNFLPDLSLTLPMFEQICRAAAELRDAGKIEILTMEEIANDLEQGRNRHWGDADWADAEFERQGRDGVPTYGASRRVDGAVGRIAIHPQPVGERSRTAGSRETTAESLDQTATDRAA